MKLFLHKVSRIAIAASCLVCLSASPALSAGKKGFTAVSSEDWNRAAVRKVLHTFAFGGFATDQQIAKWARMKPYQAIRQMLTFRYINRRLSPPDPWIKGRDSTLESLQNFWSSNRASNPVRDDRAHEYAPLSEDGTGLRGWVIPYAWVQAVNTRGVNPFLHKMALYLSNYHMAISMENATPGLMRQYYDDFIVNLQNGDTFTRIQAKAAQSAAVAAAYGHQYNGIWNGEFHGNDDFAREFHQLFFRIPGETENPHYHENVTIENTARLLTGMRVDRDRNAYGARSEYGALVGPIRFTDHNDPAGNFLQNRSTHNSRCLQILNSAVRKKNICGKTAKVKIARLAKHAAKHPEAMDNIPVYMIGFFADDNLTPEKILKIRYEWKKNKNKGVLRFLRRYAISRTFHSADTYKFLNSFDRNLIAKNMNTLSNEESFARNVRADWRLNDQQATIFSPISNVFGGQTGQQAASNPNLFRKAYAANVNNPWYFNGLTVESTAENGLKRDWAKNWGAIIPNPKGKRFRYVDDVGRWLWQRFTTDQSNFNLAARAQVFSILATGRDFGYRAWEEGLISDMDQVLTKNDIRQNADLMALHEEHQDTKIQIDHKNRWERQKWNYRIGIAVNFITATPFMFAMEGQ